MKKLLLIGICTVSVSAISQNLIKNPEFTTNENASCRSQISKAEGWSDANGGSVDLYTSKSCPSSVGSPISSMGEKEFSGNYAGFNAYYDDQRISLVKSIQNLEITSEKGYSVYSEYLQGELTEALVSGQTYSFTINVKLADNSGRAVKGLGAYFSSEKLNHSNNKALDYTPQIKSTYFITEESGWVKVSGSFTAKGGEKFMSFGAYEGSFTSKSTVEPKIENDDKRAYYYVRGGILTKVVPGDSDGDGIVDLNDPCPTEYGTVNGCPDSDGDGVIDSEDHCPYVAGSALFHGCTLSHEDILYIQKVSEKVFFITDSYVLSEEAKVELDGLAKLLKEHPEVKTTIKGHADSRGTVEYNVILSRNRAISVKDYLVSKGVEADHLSTEAHGETKPVASNETDEGRAENRHVLLSTSYFKMKDHR